MRRKAGQKGLQSHCSLQWQQRLEMDPQGEEKTTGAHPHVWRNYSSAEGSDCMGKTHFSVTEHRKQVGSRQIWRLLMFLFLCIPQWSEKNHPALPSSRI